MNIEEDKQGVRLLFLLILFGLHFFLDFLVKDALVVGGQALVESVRVQ